MARTKTPPVSPVVTKTVEDYTTPIKKGRFNLFSTPDGGFHIAYQADPTDDIPEPPIEHMDIPGAVVRAAEMMAKGDMNPMKMMSLIMGKG